ncbi:MAG: O-acetylhomoserine aminocarboxypropyltransferase/cysteine synthase [bacterium]|nr:O-acetylhomoserine aminocarboxypropyltransferase/cysteine synthase [bacterium]
MKLETLCLHAGQDVDPTSMARGVPLHRTSSYLFRDAEHAANLFSLKELGNIYTRLMNPTTDVLEKRMAALEGGVGALALSSGTSAVFYSIINICEHGDEIVSSTRLYGGTHTQFAAILPRFGITVRLADTGSLEAVEKAITSKTKALYTETIGNPSLDVADLDALSALARKHHLPLIVDNTFATPILCRPIEHGANIVVHSLTKWLGGHGTSIGGVVVDGGNFDWQHEKFPLYDKPDPGYHGLRFAHDLGALSPLAYILRMRLVPLRNLGACIAPDNAWMFLQGIETLPLRMERHCENALKLAEYLQNHKNVAWVRYPGLKDDPAHDVASRILTRGYGAVVVFGHKGGGEAGKRFINGLELVSHLANVGDAKSLALHPASTSHSQLSEEAQRAAGLPPELVRLSVGIEHIDDIIADVDRALSL